jgi:hypothetical protein
MDNLPIVEGRSCDGCTKCCEGYLVGVVNEKQFGFGEPCFLVQIGKGCKDYENRPEYPCKAFQCEWLINPDVPEDYKPSESNVIMSTRYIDENTKYLELIEAGEKLNPSVLSWSIGYSLENESNLLWSISDDTFWVGDEEFNDLMNSSIESSEEYVQESMGAFFPPQFNEFEHYKFNFEDDSETD